MNPTWPWTEKEQLETHSSNITETLSPWWNFTGSHKVTAMLFLMETTDPKHQPRCSFEMPKSTEIYSEQHDPPKRGPYYGLIKVNMISKWLYYDEPIILHWNVFMSDCGLKKVKDVQRVRTGNLPKGCECHLCASLRCWWERFTTKWHILEIWMQILAAVPHSA